MKNARGNTLVTVLIATLISGILMLAVISQLSFQDSSQKHTEIQSDLMDLRNYVAMNTDCVRTVVPRPTACDAEGPLSLRARDGGVIVGGDRTYTQVGSRYFLRASCVNCPGCANGKRILVEHLVGKMGAYGPEPDKNPLTKKVSTWQDLFREVPFGCLIPSA